MQQHALRVRLGVALAVIVGAVLLAACGSSGNTTSAPPGSRRRLERHDELEQRLGQ